MYSEASYDLDMWRRFKDFLDWLARVDSVWSMWDRLSEQTQWIVLLTGFIGMVLATYERLGLTGIFVSGLAVAGLIAWITVSIASYRVHKAAAGTSIAENALRSSRMNYGPWDDVRDFDIWHAACLWAGIPATSRIMNEAAYATFRRFKEAIRRSELDVSEMNGQHPNRHTIVSRDNLIQYAQTRGEQPPFLFRDAR